MVPLLALLTFIILAFISYFMHRKSKQVFVKNDFLSLRQVEHMLPEGVFLQSSFTWSKILDTGNLAVGIQPMLMGLIGEADEIEVLNQNDHVKKGDTLVTIRKGQKVLKVKSPIAGSIADLNSLALDESNWKSISKHWLFCIKPENMGSEVKNWFVAEKSGDWINKRYQQIKNFLIQSMPQNQIGMTMADGGDIPVGILSQFDEKTWGTFVKQFIS